MPQLYSNEILVGITLRERERERERETTEKGVDNEYL